MKGVPVTTGDSEGFMEITGSGRFSHEPEWRRVTIRWVPARNAMSIADDQRSMLASTGLDDLDIAGDGLGRYEIRRRRGSVKPIEFMPDAHVEFLHMAPMVRKTAPIGADETAPIPAVAGDELTYVGTGLSRTVAGMLFATTVAFGLAAVLYVAAGDEYSAYLEDPVQQLEEVSTSAAADGFYGLAGIGMLVTGVVFLVWFFQAYRAAASRGATGTRWSTGWAVGGWLIPFANFVIPKLVMNEVDRMSHPDSGPPPLGDAWMARPRLTTSDLWWTSWILAIVATVVQSAMTVPDTFDSVVLWAAVGSGLYAAAGGLLGSVVLTIGGRLAPRE